MSWKIETESLDDSQLVDSKMSALTIQDLADPDFEVVIGRHTEMFVEKKDETEFDEIQENDRSINEMCTVYGEIFYEMKRFISATGMDFLDKNPECDTMQDFFIFMDYCYGE